MSQAKKHHLHPKPLPMKTIPTKEKTSPKTLIGREAKVPAAAATSSVREVPAAGGASEIELHQYEKVTPLDLLKSDSWKNDGKRTPIGRRWWNQQQTREQKVAMVKVLIFFTVVIVIVGTLVGFGAHLLVKRWREAGPRLDSRLTTRTALCRAKYAHGNPERYPEECVFELHTEYQECSSKLVCGRQRWDFTHRLKNQTPESPDPSHFELSTTYMTLDNSDFADCSEDIEHRQWCQGGFCVPSGVSPERWWPSAAFPKKEQMGIRVGTDLPCIHVQNGSKAAFANLVSWYVGNCGMSECPQHCNKSICSAGGGGLVQFGLQASLDHCDLHQDPVTGVRGVECKAPSPLRLYDCHECEEFNETNFVQQKKRFESDKCNKCGDQVQDNTQCHFTCCGAIHILPDGTSCLQIGETEEPGNGVCFMGQCYGEPAIIPDQ